MSAPPAPRDVAYDALRARVEALVAHTGEDRRVSARDVEAVLRELRAHHRGLVRRNRALRAADVVLRDGRARYRELYEQSPVPYLELDRAGRIVGANVEAQALLGVPGGIVGRPLSAFLETDDADALHRHRVANVDGGGIEVELVGGGDRRVPARLDLVPMAEVCLVRCAGIADRPQRARGAHPKGG